MKSTRHAARASHPAGLSREDLLHLYRQMALIRRFELTAQGMYRNGELPGFLQALLRYTTSHTYVNMARCCAQIMLYHYEPKESLLTISRFIMGEMTRKGGCLFVTGSSSEREQFSYNQNGRENVSESCVTAYLIRWFDALMRLEGDLRYGDLIERAVYNALFAAQDPAGRKLRYFTPFEGPRGYFHLDGFCCPGNYRRIIGELPEMVYYRTSDGGIAVNLFTESKKTIELGGGRSVTIRQQTDYPTSGLVKMTVTPAALAAEAIDFLGGIDVLVNNASITMNVPFVDVTGQPIDIAKAVVFLASDDARYIIGQALIVDGGTTSWMPFGNGFRQPIGGQFGRGYVPGL